MFSFIYAFYSQVRTLLYLIVGKIFIKPPWFNYLTFETVPWCMFSYCFFFRPFILIVIVPWGKVVVFCNIFIIIIFNFDCYKYKFVILGILCWFADYFHFSRQLQPFLLVANLYSNNYCYLGYVSVFWWSDYFIFYVIFVILIFSWTVILLVCNFLFRFVVAFLEFFDYLKEGIYDFPWSLDSV